MHFDWTINAGNVIEFLLLAITILKILHRMHKENSDRLAHMEASLARMNLKMGYLWAWFAKEHNMPTGLLVDEDVKNQTP